MNIEKWKSNKGNREDHYFVDKESKIYLFGYNPKYISRKQIKEIEKIIYGERKN